MSSEMRNVFFVGPRKTATSWLRECFLDCSLENVLLSRKVKETFYFDKFFSKGKDWYERLYEKELREKASTRIEFSPSYFTHPDVPNRILGSCENVSIIITLRDPVERSISDYLHHYRYGHVGKNILEGLKRCPDILESSRYSVIIPRWKLIFKNTHEMRYESLLQDARAFLQSALKLAGFEHVTFPAELLNKKSNTGEVMISQSIMAASATRVGFILREFGLTRVINALKKLGLKEYLYGGTSSKAEVDIGALREILNVHLKDEVRLYKTKSII